MKILNICSNTGLGGIEKNFIDLNIALKELNHQLICIAYPKSLFLSKLKEYSINVETSIFVRKTSKLWFILSLIFFKIYLSRIKPELIITHYRNLYKILKLAKSKTTKLIIINHGLKVEDNFKEADLIVAVNPAMMEQYQNLGMKNVYYLPNFINCEHHQFNFIIPKQPIIFGSLGRFTKEKGFENLIKAAYCLQQQNFDFKLIIGGDGKLRENLIKLIVEYNLEDKVTLPGWITNKQDFFNQINIFCTPSSYESFGIAILEAMLHSKPVVATDCEGPLTLIEHNQNGLIVEKEQPEKLAMALKQLSENPQQQFDFAQINFEKVCSIYSNTAFKSKLTEMLQLISN